MIATTRSFEKSLTKFEDISERVSTFTASCSEKLRNQNSHCNMIMVFVHIIGNSKRTIKVPNYIEYDWINIGSDPKNILRIENYENQYWKEELYEFCNVLSLYKNNNLIIGKSKLQDFSLLANGLPPEIQAQVEALSIEQLEDLSIAVLDFDSVLVAVLATGFDLDIDHLY